MTTETAVKNLKSYGVVDEIKPEGMEMKLLHCDGTKRYIYVSRAAIMENATKGKNHPTWIVMDENGKMAKCSSSTPSFFTVRSPANLRKHRLLLWTLLRTWRLTGRSCATAIPAAIPLCSPHRPNPSGNRSCQNL